LRLYYDSSTALNVSGFAFKFEPRPYIKVVGFENLVSAEGTILPHLRNFMYVSRDLGATETAVLNRPNVINLAGAGHEEVGPGRYRPPPRHVIDTHFEPSFCRVKWQTITMTWRAPSTSPTAHHVTDTLSEPSFIE